MQTKILYEPRHLERKHKDNVQQKDNYKYQNGRQIGEDSKDPFFSFEGRGFSEISEDKIEKSKKNEKKLQLRIVVVEIYQQNFCEKKFRENSSRDLVHVESGFGYLVWKKNFKENWKLYGCWSGIIYFNLLISKEQYNVAKSGRRN